MVVDRNTGFKYVDPDLHDSRIMEDLLDPDPGGKKRQNLPKKYSSGVLLLTISD